jgi:hypothetical protein
MENRKIGISKAEVDATKIVEDSAEFLVVPAILAREGVYPYPEGKAYKPAAELKDAVWTAERAWVLAEKHPDSIFLMDRDLIIGQAETVKFCDEINGIIGNLRFKKAACDAAFLDNIKTGKRKDVSLGFFYIEDRTPGEFKGQKYDFVQRKFLIDHVAAGVPVGRCRSPYCGIAVDSILKVAVDPEETEDFVHIRVKDPDLFVDGSFRTIDIDAKKGIKAVIGKLKSDPKGSTVVQKFIFDKSKDWTMEKAQTWIKEHKDSKDSAAQEMSEKELRTKIEDLEKQRTALIEKLYPRAPEVPEEEARKLRLDLTLLDGEVNALIHVLAEKLAGVEPSDQSKGGESEKAKGDSLDAFCEIERARKLLSK